MLLQTMLKLLEIFMTLMHDLFVNGIDHGS